MKIFRKTIVFVLMFAILCTSSRVQAEVPDTVLKMCSGKWDRCTQDGINTHYCVFTKNYQKWYYNGKYDYKVKIVKVVKKSKKLYVFNMKSVSGGKFHYEAVVKKGKIIGFDYFENWSGHDGYSGGSSLFKIG